MIFLPEAEIVRRDLDRDLVGKKIKDVDVSVAKVVKRSGNRTTIANALIGVKLTSLERIGTHLVFGLDSDDLLVLALSHTTSVRRNANKDKVEDDTVFTIRFTQTGQLRLIDPKETVEVFLVPADQPLEDTVPEIADFGMDPLAKPMAWTDFGRRILRLDGKLKTILCDDSVIVGLGDIYSDEILFEASLRYDRTGSSLNTQEVRRFFRSVVSVLNDAVKYRGTTIDAAPFETSRTTCRYSVNMADLAHAPVNHWFAASSPAAGLTTATSPKSDCSAFVCWLRGANCVRTQSSLVGWGVPLRFTYTLVPRSHF